MSKIDKNIPASIENAQDDLLDGDESFEDIDPDIDVDADGDFDWDADIDVDAVDFSAMDDDEGDDEDFVPKAPVKSKKSKKKAPPRPLIAGVVDPTTLATRPGQEKAWGLLAEHISNAIPVIYSPMAQLTLGDVVSHRLFGMGVVVGSLSPQKVEVLFADQLRRLVCNRANRGPETRAA